MKVKDLICPHIPRFPFGTRGAFGFLDKDDRPTFCGGIDNPEPQHCFTYHEETSSWELGPVTQQPRIFASAVRLDDGTVWVIGGDG